MDVRRHRLADLLLLIEKELRALGWWTAEPPDARALASEQPFCVDTLPLQAWLQWVLLPRIKALLESDEALPRASGISVMAEEVFQSSGDQVLPLLQWLTEIDRVITES